MTSTVPPRVEPRYVCHRAANAIITEVDPLRVSTDALQCINQFLDEFLSILVHSARSFDLSRLKASVLELVPSSLGKNAIVEAEMQVKSFTETTAETAIDYYDAYERTRHLDDQSFDRLLNTLRMQCADYCTLAEKNHQQHQHQQSATERWKQSKSSDDVSPIVTVYVTAVIEHMAEYILTAIAITAEHEDTEYIRVREVFLTLIDDAQVGSLFQRMELRGRLEKRASSFGYYPKHNLPSPAPSPVTSMQKRNMRDSTMTQSTAASDYVDAAAGFDYSDADNEDALYSPTQESRISSSSSSVRPTTTTKTPQPSKPGRPVSIISTSTSTNTVSSTTSSGSRKGFRLFRKDTKRSSVSYEHATSPTSSSSRPNSPPPPRVSVSVYNSDSPVIDFEELIRSGDTVRVSLTPSRLKSIEIMSDHSVPDEPKTTSTVHASTRQQQQPRPASSNHPHVSSPLPQRSSLNHGSSPARDTKPPGSSLKEPIEPFENPRSAPKPPVNNHRPSNTASSSSTTPPAPRMRKSTSTTTATSVEKMQRPSSMVAKRASMISSARPTSFHESFALHYAETGSKTPSSAIQLHGGVVRDKVLRFEQGGPESASPLLVDRRRDRTLYVLRQQQETTSVQRQQRAPVFLPPRYVIPVDMAVQTDLDNKKQENVSLPQVVVSTVSSSSSSSSGLEHRRPSNNSSASEKGMIEGDEEWFVPDEVWEEEDTKDKERTVTEWLLGN